MEILYSRCAGVDVHKKTLRVCLLMRQPTGELHKEFRTYGTTTQEILALADWLKEHRCTHVAMEATGVYWKPVYNLLEDSFELLVVNARHIKAVPGRKTVNVITRWFSVFFRARKCDIMKGTIPAEYLTPPKKRVYVPHHIITRSSRLLSRTSESNRGSCTYYCLCHDIKCLLS